jgi:tripartite-type tricarboxylate transporter receptor subunit TctC
MPMRLTACLLCAALAAAPAAAQPYPAKPVRIVAPFPAGGGLDITARAIAQKLGEIWSQSVVVENRPGASGMIGAESVVRSPKDGYTLLMCSPAEVALNPALYSKMAYDPFRDLAPATLVAVYPNVIAVHSSVPVKSVRELVALSKRIPEGLAFGSSGTGSTQHLAGEWLRRNAGFNILHVPYKGAAPATTDLVGGQIPLAILGMAPLVPHMKSGRIRGLAVTTAQRSSIAPDIPTLAEAGVQGFESSQWFGLLAPAGTPPEVIAKIQSDVRRALASPDIRERFASLGGEPASSTPEEFTRFLRAENEKYAKIIREAGIRAE